MWDSDAINGVAHGLNRCSVQGGVDPGSSYPNLANHTDAEIFNPTTDYSMGQLAHAPANAHSDTLIDATVEDNERSAPVQEEQQAVIWDSDWSEEE